MESNYTYEIPHIISDKTIKKSVKVWEYDVTMPKSPPLKEYVNFGLPEKKQKFHRTELPRNLRTLPREERDKIIDLEFQRRYHGIWILVKGYPLWIPGLYYYYLNYWTMEDGGKPEFCIHDLLWFYWWHYIVNDSKCFGGYDIKPRRVGDTEKALCVIYEYCSRVRNVRGGMQNKTGDDAFENYMRLINAHQNMVWFFKPINQGTTEPKKGLKFRMPEKKITSKGLSDEEKEEYNIADEEDNIRALNSSIDYKPTVEKAYDGKRRERYHLDEVGKMDEQDMDPTVAWGTYVKPTLTLKNGSKIIGKGIVTTTVQEIKSLKSLEYAKWFWDGSDPANINKNGSTSTGLLRIFRDAITCGNYDEFGFPTVEENIAFIENEVAHLISEGKLKEAIEFRRKYPRNIDDALTPSAETCLFNAAGISAKIMEIQNYTNSKVRRGNLVWVNGIFGGSVEFIDHPQGDFEFSELFADPSEANKKIHYPSKGFGPGNYHRYCIGVDPYDHDTTNDGRMSNGAICIFKKHDFSLDGLLDRQDEDQVRQMKSNRFVGIYCIRKDSAELLYEDALKAAIYFGCEVLVETNKPGLRNYFNKYGFARYLMFRPEETKTSSNNKKNEVGAASTVSLIDQYLEAIQVYTANYCPLVEHYNLLKDWQAFTRAKRTKHDLTVASGFALLGANKRYAKLPDEGNENSINSHWFHSFKLSA